MKKSEILIKLSNLGFKEGSQSVIKYDPSLTEQQTKDGSGTKFVLACCDIHIELIYNNNSRKHINIAGILDDLNMDLSIGHEDMVDHFEQTLNQKDDA